MAHGMCIHNLNHTAICEIPWSGSSNTHFVMFNIIINLITINLILMTQSGNSRCIPVMISEVLAC